MRAPNPQKSESSFLVVGVLRNCERTVRDDVLRLRTAIGDVRAVHWLLIESDSTDKTPSTVAGMSAEIANFTFVSFGALRDRIPQRTARIATCRNAYVEAVRSDPAYRNVDYVVVADFDGVNKLIDGPAIDSCWARTDWDMAAANQRGPYYDIWALRHPIWCPSDCWEQHRFLSGYRRDWERLRYASVYSRMITVPPHADWIEVESAFGGLAMYRRTAFELGIYIGQSADGEEVCEHVAFHAQLRAADARLFINPALINAGETEHSRARRWSSSTVRRAQDTMKLAMERTLGRSWRPTSGRAG